MIYIRNKPLEESITKQHLDQWKKDFQSFTKAIRNIKTGKDLYQLFKASGIFRDNFEKFIYNELLGQQLTRSSNNEVRQSKSVASAAWDLVLNIQSVFNIKGSTYYYTEKWPSMFKEYIPEAWDALYNEWNKSRSYFYNKLGAIGRKVFDTLDTYFNSQGKDVLDSLHVEDTFTKNGIRFKVSYDESDPRWKSNIQRMLKIVDEGNRVIKSNGFSSVLHNLVIEIDLTGGMTGKDTYATKGLVSALYKPGADILSLGSLSFNVHTYIHELGHRYHFQIMNPQAAKVWKQYYDDMEVVIPSNFWEDVFNAFDKTVIDLEKKHGYIIRVGAKEYPEILKNIKDPLIQDLFKAGFMSGRDSQLTLFGNYLSFTPSSTAEYINQIRKETMAHYNREHTTTIQLNSVSQYGTTNDLEFFAETFSDILTHIGNVPVETHYMFNLVTKRR